MTLTAEQIQAFKRKLREREQVLRQAIHGELLRSDDKNYAELAGRVLDPGEQAVTDVLADYQIAELQQELTGLADVEAAQQRITDGSYGECQDCGADIDPRRLDAYPTAKRCLACQARHENQARDRTPSL